MRRLILLFVLLFCACAAKEAVKPASGPAFTPTDPQVNYPWSNSEDSAWACRASTAVVQSFRNQEVVRAEYLDEDWNEARVRRQMAPGYTIDYFLTRNTKTGQMVLTMAWWSGEGKRSLFVDYYVIKMAIEKKQRGEKIAPADLDIATGEFFCMTREDIDLENAKPGLDKWN